MDLLSAVHWLAPCLATEGRGILRLPQIKACKGLIVKLAAFNLWVEMVPNQKLILISQVGMLVGLKRNFS